MYCGLAKTHNREGCGFLHLAGYYRKFVRNFRHISKPLTDMLHKDSFQWHPTAELAFQELKTALTTTPVLALPDFSKKFVVECDASNRGIRDILSQEQHPIAYLSKALSDKHCTFSVYDKEMLGVVLAVQHWHPYLLGQRFTILTDHNTIKHFLEQRITTPTQEKWLLKLLGYNYDIQYRTGTNNAGPDALSHKTELLALMGLSTPVFDCLPQIIQDYAVDQETQQLIQTLQANTDAKPHYLWKDNCLYYKGRVFVPSSAKWRALILEEFHSSPVAGHSGQFRTYKRILRSFSWPGLKKDVKAFVAACDTSQRQNYEALHPPGLLQPLLIPDSVWQD